MFSMSPISNLSIFLINLNGILINLEAVKTGAKFDALITSHGMALNGVVYGRPNFPKWEHARLAI